VYNTENNKENICMPKKITRVGLRLTERERLAIAAISEVDDCSISEWIRRRIREEAVKRGIWDKLQK
jgi:hypothetical protein